jgi:hypothetical protein
MKTRIKKKHLLFFCGLILAAVFALYACMLNAGEIKTYHSHLGFPDDVVTEIVDDSFTIAGTAGQTDTFPNGYRLIFSAGQPFTLPAGQNVLSGGAYELEPGFISGIEAVYTLQASIQQITPAAGAPAGLVPGALITYKLDFYNPGEAAEMTVIDDPIPANLTYASGTIFLTKDNVTVLQSDAINGDPCGYTATSSIRCVIPNLGAGATGAVTFQASVN